VPQTKGRLSTRLSLLRRRSINDLVSQYQTPPVCHPPEIVSQSQKRDLLCSHTADPGRLSFSPRTVASANKRPKRPEKATRAEHSRSMRNGHSRSLPALFRAQETCPRSSQNRTTETMIGAHLEKKGNGTLDLSTASRHAGIPDPGSPGSTTLAYGPMHSG
jgi:hypothetical protein